MASSTEKLPGFLPRRELLERLYVLRHDRLCRNQDKQVLDKPFVVVAGPLFRPLERVGTWVEKLGRTSATRGCIQTPKPCAFCSMNTALYWS